MILNSFPQDKKNSKHLNISLTANYSYSQKYTQVYKIKRDLKVFFITLEKRVKDGFYEIPGSGYCTGFPETSHTDALVKAKFTTQRPFKKMTNFLTL